MSNFVKIEFLVCVSGMNLTLSDDEKYYFCEMFNEVYNFVSQEG